MQLIQREPCAFVIDEREILEALIKAFVSVNPGRMCLSEDLKELIYAILDKDDYVGRFERCRSTNTNIIVYLIIVGEFKEAEE